MRNRLRHGVVRAWCVAYATKRRTRTLPPDQYSRAEIFARWGERCCYCNADAEHLDHVNALSNGGEDKPHNLVPACADCNLAKSSMSLAEWAATF